MFSLVIPTHNRAAILRRSMAYLLQLEGIENCEIIVVNDGSTDDTAAVLEEFRQAASNLVRVFTLPNSGPARARNCGVKAARNERILFVDDDVFPRPGMLQSHARLLDQGYTGSQGLLVWHEDVPITPLIRYIDSRGSQFAFDQVQDQTQLKFSHVYTGNLAVLRSAVLAAGGFDEEIFDKDMALAAFEDTILGYSLIKNGARLALNREAIADHLHDMTEQGFFQREYKVGYYIGRLRNKYPDVARSLGWDRNDNSPQSQVRLLRLFNKAGISKPLLGYALSMRLRQREAFLGGMVKFKRESGSKEIAPRR